MNDNELIFGGILFMIVWMVSHFSIIYFFSESKQEEKDIDLLGITRGRTYGDAKRGGEYTVMIWYWFDRKTYTAHISYSRAKIIANVPSQVAQLKDYQIIRYLQKYLPNKDRTWNY